MKCGQKGTIIPLFAVFTVALISLLMFAVDGFFLLQSRLDQENIGEYLALAALSGYYDSSADPSNFSARQQKSINAIAVIANDNAVIGLGPSSTNWSFSSSSCSGATCSGSGWTMEFGIYNDSSFTSSTDPLNVNAIRLSLSLTTGGSFLRYFHSSGGTPQLPISVTARSMLIGPKRYFRLAR